MRRKKRTLDGKLLSAKDIPIPSFIDPDFDEIAEAEEEIRETYRDDNADY